ncbi:DUF6297 family protein [Phytoactinopolyspora endophytica]|uniref:DUF6297 family protein n=1 Tax=Phytoactinopolyspora endophytica TaxID=1642495 RepID=UPI00101CE8AE|nr:DUF6297 family protein [Phytoactinopolyspora endophytica]
MTGSAHVAIALWRGRRARARGDRAFLVYSIVMAGLVAVVPVGRAVWLSATSEAGIALFSSSAAPGFAAAVAVALWAGALLLGRDRGPALRPPFLTYALGTSGLSRAEAFGAPLLRAGTVVIVATMAAAGLAGGSLLTHGLADPAGVVVFTAAGALVGVVATVAWLTGQVFPRAAVLAVILLIGLGSVGAALPAVWSFTPWVWVGLAYPGGESAALPALAAAAVALVALVPSLMERLGSAQLDAQAAQWESATARAAIMDFNAAATIYQNPPHVGRRMRAIRRFRSLRLMFLVRDAIGALRTPGRLIVGLLALVAAGVLITFAFAPTTPGWLLGAVAGLLAFGGLGPFSDGIRHAADVASGHSVYGISDERLLVNHALLPLVVVLAVVAAAVVVWSTLTGLPAVMPLVSSLALGCLSVIGRISSALKGMLPPSLLTPIPTPMGDLGAAVHMTWALDAALLSAILGAAAVLAFEAPLLLASTTIVILGVGLRRWRHRT